MYSFDLEDNITKVENTAGGANGLGGAYVNTYNYDDLYRLTAANGSYSGNNTNYSLEMAYTPAGRLCSKLQDFTATANTYAYSPNTKPHAVRRYYNGLTNELYNLRWDNNGNLAQQTVYSVANNTTNYQTMRMLFWDEDDRLNLVAGDGYLSYYAYGHDGNRAIKMTGNAAIDQTVVRLLASLSFNSRPFFCLETKETKVQGCEKKAKKRLRSAKVVKLAQ